MVTPNVNKNVDLKDKENPSYSTLTSIVNRSDDCVNNPYKLKLRRKDERENAVFGTRLREIREQRGHTQESLGRILGEVTKQQISRWENGDVSPNGETLALIAKVLEVSADYLLGLVDKPTERLTESDLSPMEYRLIAASRSGELAEAIQTVLSLNQESKQAGTSSG